MKGFWLVIAIVCQLIISKNAFAATASADIRGTDPKSKITGKISFKDSPEGLIIKAVVNNAKPGKHGFHVHENGSCEDAGKAAGAHFNPDKSKHGLLEKAGFSHAHAGDLGNIQIGKDGNGKYEATVPHIALIGKYSFVGKAVILHEKEDDFSQPAGNAGGRIGCGVIHS